MLNKEYFCVTDSLNKDFINPINSLSDRVLMTFDSGYISSIVYASDPVCILSVKVKLDNTVEDGKHICISNVKKLKNYFNYLPDDSKIYIDTNNLSYKSPSLRFKYHLMDESFMQDNCKLNASIYEIDSDTTFLLTQDKVKELIRAKSLSPSVSENKIDKVYFKFTEGKVYAELTDKTQDNCDSIEILIADNFEGDTNVIGIPLPFQLISFISQNKKDFVVKYSSQRSFFRFIYKDNNTEIIYIVSEYAQ